VRLLTQSFAIALFCLLGDWVIADDPTTPGEIEKRQVLQTFVREADVLVDLHVDGEVISTTEEHPFWVVDKGWVEASDLRVGDLLITEDGVIIDVDGIEKREGDFEVYNFEVEDFHTYFVSDLEVLVHNECVFRTMSEKEYKRVVKNNGLSIRESGSSELGITRDPKYLDNLRNRKTNQGKYEVNVEFEVNDGTYEKLRDMGAAHGAAQERYPDLPPYKKGMKVPQVKIEKGNVESILLGNSPDGVQIFNDNIIEIHRLNNAE